ncbi:MAG: Mur ligase domain-containing protein, partial [Actinomycetota bacterium]|nr:Mur ligase domain-containing protein [Actinomycetota bacterium]
MSIDSREVGPGTLFVGLPGSRHDGGAFVSDALAAGAWGVLASRAHAQAAADQLHDTHAGVILAADTPLGALQSLATAWRRSLGADVIGVTGSTGKTSTKDIL